MAGYLRGDFGFSPRTARVRRRDRDTRAGDRHVTETYVQARCAPEDKARYRAAAESMGWTLQDWIIHALERQINAQRARRRRIVRELIAERQQNTPAE